MTTDLSRLYRKPDRLQQLSAFRHTAELGSLSRAADALSLAPEAVALHVRELEHELGAALLDRDMPGLTVTLTPAGECLHALVHPLLDELGGLADRVGAADPASAGPSLHVVSEEGMALEVVSRTIGRLLGEHPALGPRVRAGPFHEGLKRLLADEESLVFGAERPVPDRVVFRPMLSAGWVAAVPAGHPLAEREAVTVEELGPWAKIGPSPESLVPGPEGGEWPYRHPGLQRNVVVETNEWPVAHALVEAGVGIIVCESLAVPKTSRLSVVPLTERFPARTLGLFHRRDRPGPRFLRHFVEAVWSEFPDASSQHRDRAGGTDSLRSGRGDELPASRSSEPPAGDGAGAGAGGGGGGGAEGRADSRAGSPARTDPLRKLRAFCFAVKHRSISRAAEQAFSNQPTASKWIRDLEAEFGTRLFVRSTGGIAPTPAAKRVFRHAMPLVHALDRLPESFAERSRGEAAGGLRIGAGQTSAAAWLPKYLGRFRESCPGVEINVRTGTGPERLEWLRDFDVDLVVGAMDVEEPEFERQPLGKSSFVLITPEGHPLAGRESVDLADVARYPSVGHPADHYTSRVANMVFRRQGLVLDRVLEVAGWNEIKHYVEAGVGIAIVPEMCIYGSDRLRKVPVPGAFPSRRYSIFTRREATPALAVERFLGIVASDVGCGRGVNVAGAGSRDDGAAG